MRVRGVLLNRETCKASAPELCLGPFYTFIMTISLRVHSQPFVLCKCKLLYFLFCVGLSISDLSHIGCIWLRINSVVKRQLQRAQLKRQCTTNNDYWDCNIT